MRQFGRILLNVLTGVSLVLCVAMMLLLCSGTEGEALGRRIGHSNWLSISGTQAAIYPIVRERPFVYVDMTTPRYFVWFPATLLLFGPLPLARGMAWCVRRVWRPKSNAGNSLCPACGYDLRATPDRCPECGGIPQSAKTQDDATADERR